MLPPSRLIVLFSVLNLASCITQPTAPEPPELTRSSEELRQKSKATRSLGTVELFADAIRSSQDEKGRSFHLASGSAQLIKKSVPAISAKAPEILLNPDYAELRGRSVVKKEDQLFFGDSDASKIIIDGVQLRFEGPHSVKRIGPAKAAAKVIEETEEEEVTAKPAPAPEPQVEAKPKPKPVSNPKPKPVTKPAPAKPAPVTKPTPVDRAKLLQLMREPE
jgi:hypothetical protein